MKAKRCKLCGCTPKYIYYAIPEQDFHEGWYESEEGVEPYMLLKRLECSGCGATVAQLGETCDDAVEYWNKQNILMKYGEAIVMDVEEQDERGQS